ncbi:alanine racemase [Pseudoduganella ginsengisoli]|uniref:Alanine racemase n=1 Tax=Pseudoduganella ginsengisoli TaxID=1462440 RepID=A0A6L6PW48_9BURK|nr:alanine racemase [Pseudoduganella ginsengisoli]
MNTPESRCGAVLTIDLAAIAANYRLLQQRVGPAACSAVMKADAYGLGAAQVAPVLRQAGCRHFFVAHLEEGIALRKVLRGDETVYVLHGAPPGAEMDMLEFRLVPVLNSQQQLTAWQGAARQLGRRLPAIVQVDSGMSRMGMPPAEVDAWLAQQDPKAGLDLHYVMSHLAVADEPDHPFNREQLARFTAIRARLGNIPGSLANSSGIFLGPDYHFGLARPGVALYGGNPLPGSANPMQPVVTLQGRVVQARTIAAGDYVGYALSYQAPAERTIATVSVGYADGWLRHLSNKGHVLIGGARAPVVGRVSMDSMTVDVTGIAPSLVTAGALVDLLSPEQTVDDVAALAGTIGYEILTSLGQRYHRRYIGD